MRTLCPFLLNRYVITFGSIAVLVAAWNVYVAMNNDGVITGRVVGPDGRPVAGATVLLSERSLLVSTVRARALTDAEGAVRFSGHRLYHLYLEAEKEGMGRQAPTEFRLYFKGQNLVLREPLHLTPGK